MRTARALLLLSLCLLLLSTACQSLATTQAQRLSSSPVPPTAAATATPEPRTVSTFTATPSSASPSTATPTALPAAQGTVTAVEIVQYLTELLWHLRGPVVALLDRCQIHRDGKVAEFCRRHRRLHLEWFPAYAPELNPEEYVWSQTKRTVSNSCPENRDDLLNLVVDALCAVKASPSRLAACLAQAAKYGLAWDD